MNKPLTPVPYWETIDETYAIQQWVPGVDGPGGNWMSLGRDMQFATFPGAELALEEFRVSRPGVRMRIKRNKFEVYHDGGF
jgi:hypothetical protein